MLNHTCPRILLFVNVGGVSYRRDTGTTPLPSSSQKKGQKNHKKKKRYRAYNYVVLQRTNNYLALIMFLLAI